MYFLKTLWLIVRERVAALKSVARQEWYFHAHRAELWAEENDIPDLPDYHVDDHAQYLYQKLFEGYQRFEALQTARWARLAGQYGHSLPPLDTPGFYRQVEFDLDEKEPYYLTDKGKEAFRDTLRAIQKERRETVTHRAALFFGVFGMLTALAAVIFGS